MARHNRHLDEQPPQVRYSGFCVGGIDRPHPELEGVINPEGRLNVLRRIAAEETRSVHERGGNLIQLFYSMNTLARSIPRNRLTFPRSLRASPEGPGAPLMSPTRSRTPR